MIDEGDKTIIRERDKKGIIERIAANEERIRSIRSEIDDLECEMSFREDDLDTDQKCLASIECDSDEYHVLAREKTRPKSEVKLNVFVEI